MSTKRNVQDFIAALFIIDQIENNPNSWQKKKRKLDKLMMIYSYIMKYYSAMKEKRRKIY